MTQRVIASSFTLPDVAGRSVSLSAYKGRVVLLDFWATWCGGCKTELPWYVGFDKTYRSQGLAVVGIAMDDQGVKVVRPFIEEKGIGYTILMGNDVVAKQYALGSMPLTLLIDRSGRIALSHAGVVNKADWEDAIQKLLRDE